MAKKTYHIKAEGSTVFGHTHGEEFEADLSEEGFNEKALLNGGLLEVVKPNENSKE